MPLTVCKLVAKESCPKYLLLWPVSLPFAESSLLSDLNTLRSAVATLFAWPDRRYIWLDGELRLLAFWLFESVVGLGLIFIFVAYPWFALNSFDRNNQLN